MLTMTTPLLTDFDLHLLGEGNNYRIYEKLGRTQWNRMEPPGPISPSGHRMPDRYR